jgi:hypothetical protein
MGSPEGRVFRRTENRQALNRADQSLELVRVASYYLLADDPEAGADLTSGTPATTGDDRCLQRCVQAVNRTRRLLVGAGISFVTFAPSPGRLGARAWVGSHRISFDRRQHL